MNISEMNKIPSTVLEKIHKEIKMISDVRNNVHYPVDSVPSMMILAFMENLTQYLAEHPDESINIGNLLTFSLVNRPDTKGEKSGNIVPDVQIGPVFTRIFENGYSDEFDTGDHLPPTVDPKTGEPSINSFRQEPWFDPNEKDPDMDNVDRLKKIGSLACDSLQREGACQVEWCEVPYTFTVLFLKAIANYLHDNPNVKIEIGSYNVFSSVTMDDGKQYPRVEFSENFKLNCKDDGATEE